MTKQELRPCPFCEHEAIERFEAYRDVFRVLCPNCAAVAKEQEWNTRPLEDALRERAEKAEEKALKLEQEDAYREMELFSLLNLLDVDKEHQSGLLDMWQTCRILAGKTIKELKANRKMIERMIERVDKVKNTLSNYFHLFHAPNVGSFLDDWNALVAEWKERE